MMKSRSFNVDDLANAVKDYQAIKAQYDQAMRMADAKRKEMESFQREADKYVAEMERHANNVRKIAKEL